MHTPYPRLYSPRNFVLGCRLWLSGRSKLTLSDVVGDIGARPAVTWRAVAALLAGVLILTVFARLIGAFAPAAIARAAPLVSMRMLVNALGVLALTALTWILWRLLRAIVRFYAEMCRLGHASRTAAL